LTYKHWNLPWLWYFETVTWLWPCNIKTWKLYFLWKFHSYFDFDFDIWLWNCIYDTDSLTLKFCFWLKTLKLWLRLWLWNFEKAYEILTSTLKRFLDFKTVNLYLVNFDCEVYFGALVYIYLNSFIFYSIYVNTSNNNWWNVT